MSFPSVFPKRGGASLLISNITVSETLNMIPVIISPDIVDLTKRDLTEIITRLWSSL